MQRETELSVSVVAVVVTFNRKDLLVQCLSALQGQSRPPDEIVVIDNSSSDGTGELLREQYGHLSCFRASRNLGGAGGFSWGVELAIEKGHSDAWLMDDDAEPALDALEVLIDASKELSASGSKPGFVASQVVDFSGRPSDRHQLTPLATSEACEHPRITAVACAHFVGVLINVDTASQTFLPVADFFIWHDDIEYTTRLGDISTGYLVMDSKIYHPEKPELDDFGWRLFHDLKNRIWLMKTPRLANRHARFAASKRIPKVLAQQASRSASKTTFVRLAIRGLFVGTFRRPRLHSPGELRASSNEVKPISQ